MGIWRIRRECEAQRPRKNYRAFFQSFGNRKPGRRLTGFLGTGKKVEQLRKLRALRELKQFLYQKEKKRNPPNSATQLLQTRHSQTVRTSKGKGTGKQQSPAGTVPEEQNGRDQQLRAETGQDRDNQGMTDTGLILTQDFAKMLIKHLQVFT